MKSTDKATLRHRWSPPPNRKGLDLVKKPDSIRVSFKWRVLECGVCALGKSHQVDHPKTANFQGEVTFSTGLCRSDGTPRAGCSPRLDVRQRDV